MVRAQAHRAQNRPSVPPPLCVAHPPLSPPTAPPPPEPTRTFGVRYAASGATRASREQADPSAVCFASPLPGGRRAPVTRAIVIVMSRLDKCYGASVLRAARWSSAMLYLPLAFSRGSKVNSNCVIGVEGSTICERWEECNTTKMGGGGGPDDPTSADP